MEIQKIINLFNAIPLYDSSNEESKFFKQQKVNTAKIILSNFKQKVFNQDFCDYSDAFILATGDMTVNANNDTHVAFMSPAPFSALKTEINDVFIDEENYIYIAMPMYNLIEYSDNYSDTSGSLWQFKRDEVQTNNDDVTIDNCQSFKYKGYSI